MARTLMASCLREQQPRSRATEVGAHDQSLVADRWSYSHADLSKGPANGVGRRAGLRREFTETHAARVELGCPFFSPRAAVLEGSLGRPQERSAISGHHQLETGGSLLEVCLGCRVEFPHE
jgi:hypothetical protein